MAGLQSLRDYGIATLFRNLCETSRLCPLMLALQLESPLREGSGRHQSGLACCGLGWTLKLYQLNRAPDPAPWGETLGVRRDYVVLRPGWHPGVNFPGAAELNDKYEADFGRPAEVLVGPAYAIVQIVADAIERAGTLDREAIRDAIAATDMTTVIGPVTFRDDGTGDVLTLFIQWQGVRPSWCDRLTTPRLTSCTPLRHSTKCNMELGPHPGRAGLEA